MTGAFSLHTMSGKILPVKIYQIESSNPQLGAVVEYYLRPFIGKGMKFSECHNKIQILQKKISKILPGDILLNIETVSFGGEIAIDAYLIRREGKRTKKIASPLPANFKRLLYTAWTSWHISISQMTNNQRREPTEFEHNRTTTRWQRQFCPAVLEYREELILTLSNNLNEPINNRAAAAHLLQCLPDFQSQELAAIQRVLMDEAHLVHNFIAKSLITHLTANGLYVPKILSLIFHPSTICRNKALMYLEIAIRKGLAEPNAISKKIREQIEYLAAEAQPLNRTIARRILAKIQ